MVFKVVVRHTSGDRLLVSVFAGVDKDHFQLTGRLHLDNDEYTTLMLALHRGFGDIKDAELIVEEQAR